MKAKFYFGIISALIIAGSPVKAQFAENRDYRNDDAGLVINNYYDNHDYYYSSRINRFHRSFAAFDYYSPVFTETYWYNYQPYSWGISIYGNSGFGIGYSVNYPVYYYGWGFGNWYNYDYGWYDPYYGSSWYWGYDPFYSSWYSPVVININVGHRWRSNYYGWNNHNHIYYNDYRPAYNSYSYSSGNRPAARYSSRDYNERRSGSSTQYSSRESRTDSRPVESRTSGTVQPRRPGERPVQGNGSNNSNNGNNQNSRPVGNNGNFDRNSNNQGNNGNNQNSRPDGNNGNFDRNSNNQGNNGNNRNSQPNGNNGNFGNTGNKGGNTNAAPVQNNTRVSTPSNRTNADRPVTPERSSPSQAPSRTQPGTGTRTQTTIKSGNSGSGSQPAYKAPSSTTRQSTSVSQSRSSSSSRSSSAPSAARSTSSTKSSSSKSSSSKSSDSSSKERSRR